MIDALLNLLTHELFIKFAVAIIGIIVINFIFRIIRKYVAGRIANPEERYYVRRLITFIGYLVIFIFLLAVFYERLRGVTIAFGLIGAGIAFSLQRVITSIAGWIAISTQHFYRIGDRVQLGEIKGDVIDINVLRTAIMEVGEWTEADLYTGRVVWISNSFVFEAPVHNYSSDFPFLWDQITIPIQYGSDYNLAQQILLEVANDNVSDYINEVRRAWKEMMRKFVIKPTRVEPMVAIEFNDNWMECTLRYVVHYNERVVTKSDIYQQVLRKIEETNGKVNIASETLQIVKFPKVNVNLPE